MTVLNDIEDAIAAVITSVLPAQSAVYTPRQAYTKAKAVTVLVSYAESEFTRIGCVRKQIAKFAVQVECREEVMNAVLITTGNVLDHLVIPSIEPYTELLIVAEAVDRKETGLSAVQLYEIALFN